MRTAMTLMLVIVVASAGLGVGDPDVSRAEVDPLVAVSGDSLLAYLTELTNIQPYSGWRNSASSGEQEAVDYVAQTLGEMTYLNSMGLTLEQQDFKVFLATEIWDSSLSVTVGGRVVDIPADALRGPRWNAARAIRFDSDGAFNDADPGPVTATGRVELVRVQADFDRLAQLDLSEAIVMVDYALLDMSVMNESDVGRNVNALMQVQPAALVVVTQFSNVYRESHGALIGDGSAFNTAQLIGNFPILYVCLEELSYAGIADWDDLSLIEAATVTWDADVFSPGQSRNLIAHIPGADASQAVILGAHIDSPNSPGALDDGSGSVVLMEVARVLDAAQVQPPVDLYLVWFGSEELGLYGSQHFVATHAELLDHTLGMLNVDCLLHPLDGIQATLKLETWPYGRFGDKEMRWADYLAEQAAQLGIEAEASPVYRLVSDSTSFAGFGVPQVNLIYSNEEMDRRGELHYAGQLHSPYDTVDLVRAQREVLVQMAQIAVAAALNAGSDQPVLRTMPVPEGRAVIVATHTQDTTLSPAVNTEFGMALVAAGLDVDMIPFQQTITAADLVDAKLVIVTPPYDYAELVAGQVDLAWTEAEINLLSDYVAAGGVLVLTNGADALNFVGQPTSANEDWSEMNTLAEVFGVTYQSGTLSGRWARVIADTALTADVENVHVTLDSGIPFTITTGQVLAASRGMAALALVPFGAGEVIVMADVGSLAAGFSQSPENLTFWNNLAAYALHR